MKNHQAQLYFDFIPEREHLYDEVTGKVACLLYDNPYTGWKVIEVIPDTGAEPIKLTGYLPNIHPDDRISARCTIVDHHIFGKCLQIDEFYKELPFHKKGVMKYMIAMVDGVGEHLAERIVDRFKENTLQVLEENPRELLNIEGISEKIIERIIQSTENINTTVKELILMGFSPKWAGRIYLRYGKDASEKIKTNPYRLIKDFKGIGFKKAEIIARHTGVEPLNEKRIQAAIFFSLLTTLRKTGHNFLYLEDMIKTTSRLLKLPAAFVESEILSARDIVIDEDRVYLPSHYRSEKRIAKCISRKHRLPEAPVPGFKKRLESIEQQIGLVFSEEQREAIKLAIQSPITVITGAAGTGKTTLCTGLLMLLDELGKTYEICAPTGKAANKLKTTTGRAASTIHRLLGYAPSSGFRVNPENPLSVDYLVIDEASMVDLMLLKAVFEGVAHKTRLIFVGDPYQIPPVEVGNSLQALVGSYAVAQSVLPQVFRQDKESTILKNANLINLEKAFPLESTEDFIFWDVESPIKMIKVLLDSINQLEKQGYHPIKDVNILTPLNKGGGDISVSNLNMRLRDHLNPHTADNSFNVFEREFRIGDKVMQRKNDYELDIYNGDIGIITDNNYADKTVDIDFYGDMRSIPYNKMDNITLNYAMTVHKAQGSEARAVIFLSTRAGCYFLLNKNLFYTAITRAKEKLIMIMPYEVVKMAIGFNIIRQSHLSRRIQKLVLENNNNEE